MRELTLILAFSLFSSLLFRPLPADAPNSADPTTAGATKSNRMGIGAQIHITTEDGRQQWNEVTTAVGYASSSDSRVHFGLGSNRHIEDMEIRWPSGIRQTLHNLEVDLILTIEEPQR